MKARTLLIVFVAALVGCQRGLEPEPPPRTPPIQTPINEAPTEEVDGEVVDGADADRLGYLELTTAGASPADTLPMLVVIHGYGDGPEGIHGLFRSYPEPTRLILPRGPHPHPSRGHSWYPLGAPSTGDEVSVAAAQVAQLVRELTAERPTAGQPVVTGFSQGGMLSFTLAAEHDGLFAAAFPIAGRLTDFGALGARADRQTVVHAFHGAVDDRIPLSDAQLSMEAMVAAGWDVNMTVVPGLAHRVNAELRQALHQAVSESLQQ